jgi:DnaJ homolog subfamily C member 19
MILKLLAALAVGYLGWRLWHGWGRPMPGTPKVPPPASPSERTEALRILGITAPEATDAEIRAAHRRLISAVHPDRGGSVELTRQINAARDKLLQRSE